MHREEGLFAYDFTLTYREAQQLAPVLEWSLRLLAGPLLTYALGDGLFATGGIPQAHPSERVAALIRLVLRGIASHGQQESL